MKLPDPLIDIHNNDSVIISETDPYGTILHANDNFCAISGYSREALEGMPHNIIRHPSMPKELFRQLWSTIKKGEVFRATIKNQKKDGNPYWVNATIMPVYENNQIVRYVAGRHYISDEKLAEELFRNEARLFGWGSI